MNEIYCRDSSIATKGERFNFQVSRKTCRGEIEDFAAFANAPSLPAKAGRESR